MRTLLFGEAIVDLICQRPASSLEDADAFVPHLGGAVANVAVGAARAGAQVALAGVAGDDPWGRWLRARLEAERVGLDWFELGDGLPTPIDFVTVDAGGAPTYDVRDTSIPAAAGVLGARLLDAVEQCDALFLTSNTLAGERERELTLAARDRARELGRPIVVDPDLRPGRWEEQAFAASETRELVKGAFVVKANAEEGRLLTGEEDPAAAADGFVAMGAAHAIVTDRTRAVVRGGGLRAERTGREAQVVSGVGGGDAFTATVLARLAATDFYAPALAAALPDALEATASALERWGALT